MLVRIVTNDETNRYLEQPFNPPATDSEAFGDEWWSVRDTIVSVLEPLGIADDYGRGDFCVGEVRNVSRGISVELTSTALLRPELLCALGEALRQAPCAYSIYVRDETYTYELFVEPDRVLVHGSPSLLHQLGLTPST